MATNPETQVRFKATMIATYGVDHPAKTADFREKVEKTLVERYGSSSYNNLEQIRKTCLERFGVDNTLKVYRALGTEAHMDIAFAKVLERCANYNVTPMFGRSEYFGLGYEHKYKLKCNVCGHEYETPLTYRMNDIDRPICPNCNPNGKNLIESEIYRFLAKLLPIDPITVNDRTILVGKELDFYIPSRKIAIEHDGLYWHSENSGKHIPEYHLNKLKSCVFHGIRLIHVFEDEWNDKSEIVKSILSSAFGVYKKTIGARECKIVELDNVQSSLFLSENHIQGAENASVRYGLTHDSELVAVMTFGKDRFSKSGSWEMHRFCNKLNYKVTGGASRLFKHFIKHHCPDRIISYSDRRYFTGELYHKLGFQFVSNTPISYFYITPDFKKRLNRMRFMKHKQHSVLEKFDANLTEWQNMQVNGFDRIWDCGNLKFVWKSEPTTLTHTTTMHQ